MHKLFFGERIKVREWWSRYNTLPTGFSMPQLLWRRFWRSIKILGLVGLLFHIKTGQHRAPWINCLLWQGPCWWTFLLDWMKTNFPLIYGPCWRNMLYVSKTRPLPFSLLYILFRYGRVQSLSQCQKPWENSIFEVVQHMFWSQSCRILEWKFLGGIPGVKE